MNHPLIRLVLTVLLTSSAFCADPQELEQLRSNYKRDLAQAQQPVQRRYRDALTMLMNRYTQARQLDAANAVQAELKAIEESTRQGTGDASVVERLVDTRWQWWGNDQFLDFHANGKATCKVPNRADADMTWKVQPNGQILLVTSVQPRKTATLEFDGEKLKLTPDDGGAPWKMKFLGKNK